MPNTRSRPPSKTLTLLAALASALAAACGDDSGGSVYDAGQDHDASTLRDASTTADAATPSDAAITVSGDDALTNDDGGEQFPCTLAHTLLFGRGGGFINSQTTASLDRSGALTITYSVNGPMPKDTSCTPALPACGSGNKVDLADIAADLADPDVVDALAQTEAPFFGGLAIDTGVFAFNRDDGKSFSVAGGVCDSDDASVCVPTPAGVQKLVDDLDELESNGLASAACADLMK